MSYRQLISILPFIFVLGIYDSMGDWWEELWKYINYLYSDLKYYIFSYVPGVWPGSEWRDEYWDEVKWDWNQIKTLIWNLVITWYNKATDWTNDTRSRLEDAYRWVRDKSGQVWDWIRDRSGAVWDWIRDRSGTVWAWVRDRSGTVWDWIRDRSGEVWNWIRDRSGTVWDWIRDKSWSVWYWIAERSGQVWDWIRDKSGQVWDWIQGIGNSIEAWWNQHKGWLSSWKETYLDFYQDLFDYYRNELLDFLDDPDGYVMDIVVGIFERLVNKIFQRYWFGIKE